MTAQNRSTLKALFETGDTITQTTMSTLIDSFLDIAEVSSQTITGPIVFGGSVTFNSGTPIAVTAGGTGLSSISAYAIMVGNNAAAPSLISPSSSSGIPLISQGISANPIYGTALVAGGGTGLTSVSAYSILCGGTTNTGNFQGVSTQGTSGQVLTSNGPNVLPTWQNATVGILSTVYPIGSYYINETDSTNPATLFGFGTWVAVTDKFIVGHGSTYTATGGAATASLSATNNGAHTHDWAFKNSTANANYSASNVVWAGNAGGGASLFFTGSSDTNATFGVASSGSGTAFSIIPPYQAAYVWKRTV